MANLSYVVTKKFFYPSIVSYVLYLKPYSFSFYFLIQGTSQNNFCVWGEIRVLSSVFFHTDIRLFHHHM